MATVFGLQMELSAIVKTVLRERIAREVFQKSIHACEEAVILVSSFTLRLISLLMFFEN